MSSILRLPSRIRAPISSTSLGRTLTNIPAQQCYIHGTPSNHGPEKDRNHDNAPNHPIPSNNAHPTLRDGRQSSLSDMDGHKNEDLPEDVKKHNEEMAQRYDKPLNHISDEGTVEKTFEEK
ncbi:hypothetical protein N7466_008951 [Penicillium verhagenii]|uniref:uncharacterized protein n=1 Tax=Penicillium verhagenii TaxID=1562060 RepID=UPI0025452DBF|nr:uncharacterized protein N7466_008951 [Penicillium verhagenii]KAJ5924764.1 hypothetical protein N7466_008951 [Penicillium verhagenii]